MMKLVRSAMLFLMCISGATALGQPEIYEKAKLRELEKGIDAILKQTHTPGAAVAIVRADGGTWHYLGGVRNRETAEPVTAGTLFRLASISKMLVAQSVMKLVEQGQLSLDDRVRDLVPEVAFNNPWADTHPVRLVHLLEHATGWDAPHFAELASNRKDPLTIKEALELHPHSRVSRWVPGSRTAYNNTGPLVAAYIVEKVTGNRFENFVQATFFDPLGMNDAGYFFDENYIRNGASNYRGSKEQPYWHLPGRAAGGLHASLPDMIQYARFLLGLGNHDGADILSPASLTITERPYGSLAAHKGMELSYGLGIINIHHNGFLYHGHEGSLRGSNALLAYQRELGVAHVVLTNGETPAATMIHKLIADLETAGQEPPRFASNRAVDQDDIALSGYYKPISHVREDASFLLALLPWKLTVSEYGATMAPLLGGPPRTLLAGDSGTFLQNTTGRVALVRGEDPFAGDVLYYGPNTLKKVSVLAALLPLLVIVLWLFSGLAALLFALVWVPRWAFGKTLAGAHISVRLWPLVSIICVLAFALSVMMMNKAAFPYALAGNITPLSLIVFAATLLFPATSFWSIYNIWRHRSASTNKLAFWYSGGLAVVNSLVALYLLSYGVIAIRLWA